MNQFKHTKWDSNWQSRIKGLAKDLDQAKNKQTELLLSEGDVLHTEKNKLTKEIRQLKQEQTSLSQVFLYHQSAQKELKRLNNHSAVQTPRQNNFLGNFTGTNGWLKTAQDHFVPDTGKLDNVYQIKIAGLEYEITEEQVINTIARVVKALQKVDASDFEAKYNAKESDSMRRVQIKTYLKAIQDQAKEIIVGNAKDSEGKAKQPSYDFANSYQKYDKNTGTWTSYASPAFNYQQFFDFVNLVHNQPFLSTLDTNKQKNIDKNENWTVGLKGEVYSVEQLKDYGITIDPAKSTFYKTSETDQQTISASSGIQGWLDLAHSITQNANNQTKLISAFNNSPNQRLLSNLKDFTLVNGFTTDGICTLPESIDSMEMVVAELEAKKISSATEQGILAKQIREKNDELKKKTTDLKVKETELDSFIKEIVGKQRTKLTAYKITNGFASQHKRTIQELWQIQDQLLTIRYLENNGDSTLPSSVINENTAYEAIAQLFKQVLQSGSEYHKIYLVDFFVKTLANKKDAQPDISQGITCIKVGKYTDSEGRKNTIYNSLEEFNQHFEVKDELVKLSDWETKSWEAIKVELGKKSDPTDTLEIYQSKLKELDPLLAENVITEAIIKDWQTQNNFKTSETMKKELGKVLENKALKATFKTAMTKTDSELVSLDKLLIKKKAQEVITLIRKWDYDQESDVDKKAKTVKVIKMNLGKKPTESDPTEEEITTGLYKLAVGEYSQKSDSEISTWESGEQPTPVPIEKGHLAKNWGWYLAGGIVLAIGVGVTIFWDKLKGWWNPGESEDNE